MVNKEKVLKLISQKEDEKRAIIEKVEKANSIEELDKLNKDMDKIKEEIRGIKEAFGVEERLIFNNDEEPGARSDTDERSFNFNPMAAYGLGTEKRQGNFTELAKFQYGESKAILPNIDNVALRSNESILERMNIPKEQRGLNLGKYVKGIVTGDWKGAESEKRAMITSGTGVIIPQELSGQIIDVARNQSLFTLAQVPVIPMESDNIKLARIKNDPTFKFKEEGKEAEESSFELEAVTLQSKTCYGYAYVSLEAINSSKNLNGIITNTFSSALAEAIDQGMLYGQYNGSSYDKFAPSGIMNDTGINTITAGSNEGYDTFIKAIGKIKRNNGIPSVYGINSNTEEQLSLLKDSQGRYLEKPSVLSNLTQIISNQLKSDPSKGDEGLVFDPNAMAIGIQNNIVIQMFNNTDECIKKGLVAFRIYSMIDCVVTQPKNICKITGIGVA